MVEVNTSWGNVPGRSGASATGGLGVGVWFHHAVEDQFSDSCVDVSITCSPIKQATLLVCSFPLYPTSYFSVSDILMNCKEFSCTHTSVYKHGSTEVGSSRNILWTPKLLPSRRVWCLLTNKQILETGKTLPKFTV